MDENQNNAKKKVILLNGSRIMRSMLTRVIEEQTDMVIDREITVNADLSDLSVDHLPMDADWLITLETTNIIPQVVLDTATRNPKTRLLIVATDGSQVILRWFEEKTRTIEPIDLPTLIKILQGED